MPENHPHETEFEVAIEELHLAIADAESRGDWPRAGQLKGELLRALEPAQPTSRASSSTSLDGLRADIQAAEAARDWGRAGRLKTELLRRVASI